jgi:hypothetical protein
MFIGEIANVLKEKVNRYITVEIELSSMCIESVVSFKGDLLLVSLNFR